MQRNYTSQLLEKLEKRRIYSSFQRNIWGADIAYMKLISKYNKRFWLCVTDMYRKCICLSCFFLRHKWY